MGRINDGRRVDFLFYTGKIRAEVKARTKAEEKNIQRLKITKRTRPQVKVKK